ncbi:hypothetical protein ACOJQI_02485 [Bacillus salacetis]
MELVGIFGGIIFFLILLSIDGSLRKLNRTNSEILEELRNKDK